MSLWLQSLALEGASVGLTVPFSTASCFLSLSSVLADKGTNLKAAGGQVKLLPKRSALLPPERGTWELDQGLARLGRERE